MIQSPRTVFTLPSAVAEIPGQLFSCRIALAKHLLIELPTLVIRLASRILGIGAITRIVALVVFLGFLVLVFVRLHDGIISQWLMNVNKKD